MKKEGSLENRNLANSSPGHVDRAHSLWFVEHIINRIGVEGVERKVHLLHIDQDISVGGNHLDLVVRHLQGFQTEILVLQNLHRNLGEHVVRQIYAFESPDFPLEKDVVRDLGEIVVARVQLQPDDSSEDVCFQLGDIVSADINVLQLGRVLEGCLAD